jgi:hypothetical protein
MLSREHGDIPCGGIPSFGELRENQAPEKFLQYLTVIQTMDNENLFMVDPPPIDNIRARISYMLNYLNDDIFKDFLQRQEKHREKMREMSSIYEVLIHSGGDFLRQFIIEPRRREEIEHQLGTLFEYGNGIFENIRRRYVSVTPKNITI